MAQTIKLKRSATTGNVPTTSQLALGELGINTTDGKLFLKKSVSGTESIVEVGDTSGYLPLAGGTLTGNISLGDNGKATFGASDDLQIYHDGNNSRIYDVGTGDLRIQGTNLRLMSEDGANYLYAVQDAYTKLYYNGAEKLATTSTGIDINGIASMDGLTVDGNVQIADAVPILRLDSPAVVWSGGEDLGGIDWYTKDTSGIGPTVMARIYSESSGSNTLPQPTMIFQTSVSNGSLTDRMKIAPNGDISFYEDTGTTAKFFWDASAESLGIGTSSPSAKLEVAGSSNSTYLKVGGDDSSNGRALTFTSSAGAVFNGAVHTINAPSSQGVIALATASTERIRIDSSGNVGIGTTVTNTLHGSSYGTTKLHIDGGSDRGQVIIQGDSLAQIVMSDNGATANSRVFITQVNDGVMNLKSVNDNGTSKATIMSMTSAGATTFSGSVSATKAGYNANSSAWAESAYASSGSYGGGYSIIDGSAGFLLHAQSSGTQFVIRQGTVGSNPSTLLTMNSSGNLNLTNGSLMVGSTTAPTAKFDLSSSNSFGLPPTSGSTPNGFMRIGYTDRTWTGSEMLFGIVNAHPDYAGFVQMKMPTDYSTNRAFLINPQGGNVGIGTDSPVGLLNLEASSGNSQLYITTNDTTSRSQLIFGDSADANVGGVQYNHSDDSMEFHSGNGGERARITSGGLLLIGTTSTTPAFGSGTGIAFVPTGESMMSANSTTALFLNRTSSDGTILDFRRDGTTVGLIGTQAGRLTIGDGDTGVRFADDFNNIQPFNVSTNTLRDSAIDLGSSAGRFKDLYLSNKVYANYIGSSGDTNTNIYFPTGDQIRFTTGGSERMRIDSAGNVGIGTSSPVSPLQIQNSNPQVTMTQTAGGVNRFLAFDVGLSADVDTQFITVDQADGLAFGEKLTASDRVIENEWMRITNAGNLGIGTSSPSQDLHIREDSGDCNLLIDSANGASQIFFGDDESVNIGIIRYDHSSNFMRFNVNGSERMRIASNGTLYHGKTADSLNTGGLQTLISGQTSITQSYTEPLRLNRMSSQGAIQKFYYNGAEVGSIGTVNSNIYLGTGDTGFYFNANDNSIYPINTTTIAGRDNGVDLGKSDTRFKDLYLSGKIYGSTLGIGDAGIQADQYSNAVKPFRPDITSGTSDNYLDLGTSSVRWVDIYATNGTIQTSDRNEKQDIEDLTDAEERVAVAAKSLLKKFRWKSAVEDKGDDARIHFGIIAQDLQDAFEAEGLDAGRYGMFTSNTWTNEDGEEQTRMGVRYSELLAFIISAI